MIGTTLGKYRVLDKIGRGGMGYKAVDETLDREVAIKMLSSELAETDAVKRFKVEATTLARLNHPGIATIFELYRGADSDVAMVMEFVRGETFDRLIERCGPLPPERAGHLAAQVLDALGHAHRAGIVHRDLKPSNLMLTEYGTVKIMDFGIARVIGTEHLTNDGYMMGTPAYMAPEQVLGQDVDGRADLYSVGVVFYRLISGRLPFKADTAIAMVQRQIKDPPTPVRQFRAELPEWCEKAIDRALAKSPADRFQTAEEFRAVLLQNSGAPPVHSLLPLPDELEMTTPPGAMRVPDVGVVSAFDLSPDRDDSAAVTIAAPTPPSAERPAPNPAPAAAVSQPSPRRNVAAMSARTKAFAGAAAAIVVLAAVLIAFMARRDTPSAPSATAAPPVAAANATATPQIQEPPASVPAAPDAPIAASEPPGNKPAATASSRKRPVAAAPIVPPVAGAPAPPVPAVVLPVIASAARPPLTFEDLKVVVTERGEARQRDATLKLTDGHMSATDAQGAAIRTVSYDAVLSVTYARSRHPLWQGPAGPVVAARASDGPFGLFRGDSHWLTIRTKDLFVVLRLRGEHTESVVTAVQQRVGQPVGAHPGPRTR